MSLAQQSHDTDRQSTLTSRCAEWTATCYYAEAATDVRLRLTVKQLNRDRDWYSQIHYPKLKSGQGRILILSGSPRGICLRFRPCEPTNPMPVGVSPMAVTLAFNLKRHGASRPVFASFFEYHHRTACAVPLKITAIGREPPDNEAEHSF